MTEVEIGVQELAVAVPEVTGAWRKNKLEWTEDFKGNLLKKIEDYEPEGCAKQAKILLVGPIGAGKSSFFNTINSILKGRLTKKTTMGSSNQSLTIQYREFEFRKPKSSSPLHFKLCDTMGLEEVGGIHMEDINFLLDGQIPDKYKFNAATPIDKNVPGFKSSPLLSDGIHCVVLVVDGSSVDVLQEAYIEKLKKVQEIAYRKGITVVALITKIDKICEDMVKDLASIYSNANIQEKVETLAAKLGLPKNSIIPVKNYESEIDMQTDVDILALHAFQQLLNYCDDFIEDSLEHDEK